MVPAYNLNLTLSKIYFEVVILCLEPKIFNEQAEVYPWLPAISPLYKAIL